MTPYKKVLLTGATGFFGARLLAELLRSGASEVCCLVRSGGEERLRTALAVGGLWPEDWAPRITALAGDLERPGLGLGPVFRRLAGEVDAVFHNGANVNHVLGLRPLRAANVTSTQELLRIAEAAGAPFHFVSTLRLFDHRRDGMPIRESDPIDMMAATRNGYAHSKALSERLVRAAATRGARTAIYRPGLMCGDGCTGAPNVRDVVSLLLRACIELRAAPIGPLQINSTSVAFGARALVTLAREHGGKGDVWHLVHDTPTVLTDVFDVLRAQGYPIIGIPYAEWTARLRDQARDGESRLNPLVESFTPDLPEGTARRVFDSAKTRDALAALGVCHPAADARFWRNNVRGMAACGFIPEPADTPENLAPKDVVEA